LLLRLGEYDLATDEEEYPYVERKVQIVASHPQFDARTFEYDLALLRFYDPVRFQPNIIPICLAEEGSEFVGKSAFVTGWGRLYEGKQLFFKCLRFFRDSVRIRLFDLLIYLFAFRCLFYNHSFGFFQDSYNSVEFYKIICDSLKIA